MKKILCSLLFVSSSALAVQAGEPFPSLEIAAASGTKAPALSPATLKGKVTLVNFWATWCQACKVELADMAKVLKDVALRPNVQLAFVSLDKQPADSLAFLKREGAAGSFVAERLYTDAHFVAVGKLDVDAFPMTLIVDQDGRVVRVQRGYEEGRGRTEKLRELIVQLDVGAGTKLPGAH